MALLLENSTTASTTGAGYEVWSNPPDTQIPYVPYVYTSWLPIERWLLRPNAIHNMFANYWLCPYLLVLCYVSGIYMLQKWMHDRKAFELRTLLITWNTMLAAFSFIGAWRVGEEFVYVMQHRTFQDSVCLSISPTQPVAFWATLFTLSKVVEFGDTILLVLRKRPLIFLHWFHHAVVLIYSWSSSAELTAAGRWFIQLNYSVHALMYTYYALSSAGIKPPKFVSMGVTLLQTSQMFVGMSISLFVAFLKWRSAVRQLLDASTPALVCQQSVQNMCLCFTIYSAFAALFIRFFVRSYMRGKKTEVAAEKKKK